MVSALKTIAKRTVVHAVARVAPLTWKWRKPGSLVVLMYHRVLPKDSPARKTEQPGMYVSPETLDLHLQVLKQYFELVPLDEWLRRAKDGASLPKLACAITFDDGWRDNYEFALPVLAKHGAPATIFLVSSLIGTTVRFWPNRLMGLLHKSFAEPGSVDYPQALRLIVEPVLAEAAIRGQLRPDDGDLVVQRAKGWNEETIRGLVESAERSLGDCTETPEILSGEEIAQMAATGLIRFGSHTATHFRLGGEILAEALEREIVGSRKQLQELSGQEIDLFCYPNGDTSPGAIDCVRRHYQGAVTTQSGWQTAGDDPYLVRRIGLHEDVSNTREALLARVSGWL